MKFQQLLKINNSIQQDTKLAKTALNSWKALAIYIDRFSWATKGL
jgi:hypothetical protein